MKLSDDPRFQLKRYLAEFADHGLESDYRARAYADDSRQLFIVILFTSLFFLVFMALDLADGIDKHNLVIIIGLRVSVAIVGLYCCYALKRGLSVDGFDRVGVIFTFVLFSAFAARTVLFNFGVDEPPRIGVSGYMLIIGIYMFSALPMRIAFLIAAYGSLTFVAAAVVVELPLASLINLFFWVVIVNLLGGITAHRLNRLRRMAYMDFITLQGANNILQSEVKERKDAEESARLAQEQAEIANKAKSRFLAAASHDLRQPLHAMGMFISALSERLTGEKEKELVSKLESSVSTTNELFQAILDISKLDAGAVTPLIGTAHLSSLFDQVKTLNVGPASAKGVKLVIVNSSAKVSCDEVMLERILFNLVSNAIRYTPKGGKVLVGVRKLGKRLRIDVIDTGNGIAPDKLEAIFKEFEQLGQPERDRTQGLGLGLSISRRLAHLLGTDIAVTSEQGRGSRFSLELTRSDGVESEAQDGDATLSDDEIFVGARVLVIDDDREVIDGMSHLLSLWNCNVVTAASLEQAAEIAAKCGGLDAIVADYRLGNGTTGLAAIKAVNAAQGRDVPSIVVTGDVGGDSINAIQAEGFLPLHKPVRPSTLKTELISILAQR